MHRGEVWLSGTWELFKGLNNRRYFFAFCFGLCIGSIYWDLSHLVSDIAKVKDTRVVLKHLKAFTNLWTGICLIREILWWIACQVNMSYIIRFCEYQINFHTFKMMWRMLMLKSPFFGISQLFLEKYVFLHLAVIYVLCVGFI